MRIATAIVLAGLMASGSRAAATAEGTDEGDAADASQPAERPSLIRDAEDGYFDVSNFLSTRVGFLPIAMPITEPAIGYGLGLGLTFFHDKPKVVTYPGQPPRVIMPTMTVVFGAATESQTWAAGLGHIG